MSDEQQQQQLITLTNEVVKCATQAAFNGK